VYPYQPEVHTPKLVITKNINELITAPFCRYAIKNKLPYTHIIYEWNPIIASDIKYATRQGKRLITPAIINTAITGVKLGG
jgi:hypothetical protein